VGETFAGSTAVGQGGLGYSLYYAQTQMDTAYIFCLVAVSGVLGFGLRSIIVFLEWFLLKDWHSSYGESTN
jgi:NitT/TauT family transport system permease protein